MRYYLSTSSIQNSVGWIAPNELRLTTYSARHGQPEILVISIRTWKSLLIFLFSISAEKTGKFEAAQSLWCSQANRLVLFKLQSIVAVLHIQVALLALLSIFKLLSNVEGTSRSESESRAPGASAPTRSLPVQLRVNAWTAWTTTSMPVILISLWFVRLITVTRRLSRYLFILRPLIVTSIYYFRVHTQCQC